jgi:Fe-S oxidoreductase
LTGLWQAEAVKEALDLCLSCKGCKGDCPVSVDMATYKAEFLAHYYEEHRRPISAFAFGLIHYWARLGAVAPWLANFFTQTPGLRTVAKLASGMSLHRQIPPFAPYTFTSWFEQRVTRPDDGRPAVLLWPDTFNNYFHPRTAEAAVRVLEDAGFRVKIPRVPVCCGRPLFDYGMLDTAKRWLRDTMRALETEIESGTPIVGLEPSCVAVFRDELWELLPNDENAKRLKGQVFALSEFLEREHYRYPTLQRRALVHGHCHHQAIMKFDAEKHALAAIGLDVLAPDSGCCGMAGSFGFERPHYDVSMKVGELVLLPDVRKAAPETLIVADGFSCREQISQATNRKALHLADVLDMARREGPRGPAGAYPERQYVADYRPSPWRAAISVALVAGALIAGIAGVIRKIRQ